MAEQNLTQEAFDALLKENANLKQTVSDHEKTITDLTAKALVATAKKTDEKAGIPAKAIEVGKKKYKFVVSKFYLPGKGIVKAEDAALDKETLEKIVAIDGQGILKEQA